MNDSHIEYVRSGDAHVAYRVLDGPPGNDIVLVNGFLFPFEHLLADRVAARFIKGLSQIGRVVLFDKRGVGYSDGLDGYSRPTHEQWAADTCAVTEAAGLRAANLVSWEPLGTARRAVADRPDLFARLCLISPVQTTAQLLKGIPELDANGLPNRTSEELAFPSRKDDSDFWIWLEAAGRSGASPAAAERTMRSLLSFGMQLTPPNIRVPTLVLRSSNPYLPTEAPAGVAESIPEARLVDVPGPDPYPVSGNTTAFLAEIAEFITGAPVPLEQERHLCAILFTDLVDSTKQAAELGDEAWLALIRRHDATVRRVVSRLGGRVVKYTGDGVLAVLPSVSATIKASREIADALEEHHLTIRAGVHAGDVDLREHDVSGLAVAVAARIMDRAKGGELLISRSAVYATLGSGEEFRALGEYELKGIPAPVEVFAHIPSGSSATHS